MQLIRMGALPLLAVVAMCSGSPGSGATPTSPTGGAITCSTATAATFAWWVGKWSYSVPGYDPGTSTVTSSSNGCALAEAFVDRTGQQQHTTIRYDSVGQQWKRNVIDPFRTYNSAGTFAADGRIAFYETPTDRESYIPTDHDHVHFTGEQSTDGGKTWKLLFDATYTRPP